MPRPIRTLTLTLALAAGLTLGVVPDAHAQSRTPARPGRTVERTPDDSLRSRSADRSRPTVGRRSVPRVSTAKPPADTRDTRNRVEARDRTDRPEARRPGDRLPEPRNEPDPYIRNRNDRDREDRRDRPNDRDRHDRDRADRDGRDRDRDGRYDRDRDWDDRDRDWDDRRDRDWRDRDWRDDRPREHYRHGPHRVPGGGVVMHNPNYTDWDWPWERRRRSGWSPLYEYRQVVVTDAGWGRRRRAARLDVRTVYRHRVRSANHRRAELDIDIERIELYQGGRFLGEVRHVPNKLGRVRATLHRNGRMQFDRQVFLVGDWRSGFEMISTRHYDRHVLDAYDRAHGYRVGVLNLRRERVDPVRHSRLFDPYAFDGFVPVDLLPENRGWLFDYGMESVSTRRYRDDVYGDVYDDVLYYGYGDHGPAPYFSTRPSVTLPSLQEADRREITTVRGARIELDRTAEIRRIE